MRDETDGLMTNEEARIAELHWQLDCSKTALRLKEQEIRRDDVYIEWLRGELRRQRRIIYTLALSLVLVVVSILILYWVG